MKSGWIPIETSPDPKQGFLLVSNNPDAKDAHGHMSHVWMTSMVHGPDSDGFYSAFAHPSDQKIHGIKAWMPLFL